MSTDSLNDKPLKKAKERSLISRIFWHVCPYCEDETDTYVNSYNGEVLECPCGEKYEVTK